MTRVSLDHVVLLAPGLAQAEACFRGMGFQVTGGGTHAGGATANRLVGLSDESYLELLTFFPAGDRSPAGDGSGLRTGNVPSPGPWHPGDAGTGPPAGLSTMAARFWRRARSYGAIFDLALSVPDLEGAIRELRTQGIEVDDPVEGRRTREDGVELAWRMAFPRGEAFPFLIQDLTPRERRVPQGSATVHPNGVTGVAQVRIPVSPQDEARLAAWSRVLGLPITDLSDPQGCREVMVGEARLIFRPREGGNQGPGSRYGVVLRKGEGKDSATLVAATAQDGSAPTPAVDWELQAVPTAG